MRFIHTADWHLGRILHGHSLLEDQRHALDQLIDLAATLRPDAILVAGDVYDRAVPPHEAVSLMDEVIHRIVGELEIPMVVIAGNHDSGERLGFGARLLGQAGLHLAGPVSDTVASVRLADAHGEVRIYALPYAEPAEVRAALGDDGVNCHAVAMRAMTERILRDHPADARAVLVAHAFVAGGSISDSERVLSVGGSEAVPAESFVGFDYVALGHLHRPQSAGANARYAGSLLKYSESEAMHLKSFTEVEVLPGEVRITEHPVRALRELRVIEGDLAALIDAGRVDPARDDYVFARLTDPGALLEPMARLREVYPNALEVRRNAIEAGLVVAHRTDHGQARNFDRLFEDFWQQVRGEPLSENRRRLVAECTAAALKANQEAAQ